MDQADQSIVWEAADGVRVALTGQFASRQEALTIARRLRPVPIDSTERIRLAVGHAEMPLPPDAVAPRYAVAFAGMEGGHRCLGGLAGFPWNHPTSCTPIDGPVTVLAGPSTVGTILAAAVPAGAETVRIHLADGDARVLPAELVPGSDSRFVFAVLGAAIPERVEALAADGSSLGEAVVDSAAPLGFLPVNDQTDSSPHPELADSRAAPPTVTCPPGVPEPTMEHGTFCGPEPGPGNGDGPGGACVGTGRPAPAGLAEPWSHRAAIRSTNVQGSSRQAPDTVNNPASARQVSDPKRYFISHPGLVGASPG